MVNVIQEMVEIPRDLRDIFIPIKLENLKQFQKNLEARQKGKRDREEVFALWQVYKKYLPLSSRRWSLREMIIKTNIVELKYRMKNSYEDSAQNEDD